MKAGAIIGIAGASGSGKTFVTSRILERLGAGQAVAIQEDAYYRDLCEIPYEQRAAANFDHPDAFDHDLLAKHLVQLVNGEAITQPVYDYRRHCRLKEARMVPPCPWIILEGILILSDPKLRSLMDVRIFVETPVDICLIRRIERDLAERGRTAHSVLQQYMRTVRPMYLRYVEPAKRYADIVICGEHDDSQATDELIARIDGMLKKNRQ